MPSGDILSIPKHLVRRLITMIPARTIDLLFMRRHKNYWTKTDREQQFYRQYSDAYLTRMPIGAAIRDLIAQNVSPHLRIIEFGCSGGNNLKMLRDMLCVQIEYCGVDISPSAIEFARSRFPEATFFCCADTDLLILERKLSHYDIFLASGVLSYLPQKEAEAVLEFAARIADYIVICDNLSRFDEIKGKNVGTFNHPYGLICHQVGLDMVARPRQLGDESGYGIFICSHSTKLESKSL